MAKPCISCIAFRCQSTMWCPCPLRPTAAPHILILNTYSPGLLPGMADAVLRALPNAEHFPLHEPSAHALATSATLVRAQACLRAGHTAVLTLCDAGHEVVKGLASRLGGQGRAPCTTVLLYTPLPLALESVGTDPVAGLYTLTHFAAMFRAAPTRSSLGYLHRSELVPWLDPLINGPAAHVHRSMADSALDALSLQSPSAQGVWLTPRHTYDLVVDAARHSSRRSADLVTRLLQGRAATSRAAPCTGPVSSNAPHRSSASESDSLASVVGIVNTASARDADAIDEPVSTVGPEALGGGACPYYPEKCQGVGRAVNYDRVLADVLRTMQSHPFCAAPTTPAAAPSASNPRSAATPRPSAPSSSPNGSAPCVAYLILGRQEEASQMMALVRRLWHPDDLFYLHVDGDAAQCPDLAALGPNVRVESRIKGCWGCPSLAYMELVGLLNLLAMSQSWSHAVLLSATAFPIRPQDELRAYLHRHSGKVFMEPEPLPVNALPRVQVRWQEYTNAEHGHFACPVTGEPGKRGLQGLQLWKAEAWWALPFDFVQHVFCDPQLAGPLVAFQSTYIPDESMMQTLVMNSAWRARLMPGLMYVRWGQCRGADKRPPCVLEEGDREELKRQSGKFFARKFDAVASAQLVEALEAEMGPALIGDVSRT